ncbi:hypothetical protein NBRC116495_09660 [Aurantivibrio plasticivorans]
MKYRSVNRSRIKARRFFGDYTINKNPTKPIYLSSASTAFDLPLDNSPISQSVHVVSRIAFIAVLIS